MTDTRHLRLILHGKAAQQPAIRAGVASMRQSGHRVEVRVTWEAGDAERYTSEACVDGVSTIVAGGGDGTLNTVTAGLMEAQPEDRPALAVLPLGTANDFARSARVPLSDPTAALRIAAETVPTRMDVGLVNGRPFINVATGGFGTRITVETPEKTKKILGGAAYLLTGLARFTDIRPAHGVLRTPDEEVEGDYWAFAFGNGRQAGGGVQLCPDAIVNDGLLDVMVLPDLPADQRSKVFGALMKEGRAAIERQVKVARVPWAEVESPEEIYVNLDGEPLSAHRFRFEVQPDAIRFHFPDHSPLVT